MNGKVIVNINPNGNGVHEFETWISPEVTEDQLIEIARLLLRRIPEPVRQAYGIKKLP